MKKILLLTLLFCLILSLCSCEIKFGVNSNKMNNEDITSNKSTVLPNGERPLMTVETIKQYNKMLDSKILPQDFVKYEDLKALGEFKAFVFLSDAGNNDYSSYLYSLADSSGAELSIYVDHNKENNTSATLQKIENIKTNNMRQIPDEISGRYIEGGLVYKYVSGKLLSISWTNEGITYTLCGSVMLVDYPIIDSTFVGKMLNVDSALKTFNEFFKADEVKDDELTSEVEEQPNNSKVPDEDESIVLPTA